MYHAPDALDVLGLYLMHQSCNNHFQFAGLLQLKILMMQISQLFLLLLERSDEAILDGEAALTSKHQAIHFAAFRLMLHQKVQIF